MPTQRVAVDVTTLDAFVRDGGLECVDLVKIDVEGGERDVLMGARTLLCAKRRPVILIECADTRTAAWGYEARELPEMLLKAGFALFEAGPQGLTPHKIQELYRPYKDLVAVPPERRNETNPMEQSPEAGA